MKEFYTNSLPWQDDEDRAATLPILFTQLQGTSFHTATAVRFGPTDWTMCWWEPAEDGSDNWYQVCRLASDPNVGTITLPWCPDHPLSKRWEVRAYNTGGPGCPCLDNVKGVAQWDPEGGPFGRWLVSFDCPLFGSIEIEWIITSHVGGVTYWKWTFYDAGERFIELHDVPTACGELPSYTDIHFTDNGPCPDSIISVTTAAD